MQMVGKPQQFDVIVLPNLYGAILSNIGAGLVGGPGVVPGANLGRDVALFEPGCRHVALDIAGKNAANPAAMLLSSSLMLRHLGLDYHANAISNSVCASEEHVLLLTHADKVLSEGKVRTADLGGSAHTNDFTGAFDLVNPADNLAAAVVKNL